MERKSFWQRMVAARTRAMAARIRRYGTATLAAGPLLLAAPPSPATSQPCHTRSSAREVEALAPARAGVAEAGSWAPAVVPDTPDVRRFLSRAEARYRRLESLQARFHQTVEVTLLDRRREGEGVWYQKGRGRFKMDFDQPPGDVIVADGSHVWLYYPSTHPGQVIRSAIEASTTARGMVDLQGRIFEEARHGYVARDDGTEEVSGIRTRLVTLTPTGPSPYRRVRVWVGTGDLLVRKFEITEENETVRTVRLWDLKPNASIPDSVFGFSVPPGVEVFGG